MTVLERGGGRAGFRAPATRAQEAPKEKTMLVLGHIGHRITRRVLEKIGCISTRLGSAPHPARGPAAAAANPLRHQYLPELAGGARAPPMPRRAALRVGQCPYGTRARSASGGAWHWGIAAGSGIGDRCGCCSSAWRW